MMNWNFQIEQQIRSNLEHMALQAIAKIMEGNGSITEKHDCISGVMTMLEEIVDDMLETARMEEEEKKAFEDSGKAAKEAYDNLFDRETWLKKAEENHGTDS